MANEPVAWSNALQCYFVFGFHHTRKVLTSAQFVTSNPFRRTRTAIGHSVLDADGEGHARVRTVLSRGFKPAAIARYATGIVEPAVGELLDETLGAGRPDWLPELAARLPVRVAARIVGLPPDADEYLRETMRPLVDFIDHGPVNFATVVAHRDELRAYLRALMRRSAQTDTVIRMLGDGGLTETEVVDNALLTLVAATETTASAITNVAARIAGEPGLFALLRAQPELVDHAIGETFRHEPPLHVTLRFTTTDVVLAGLDLPAGAPVQVCLASANRDPALYRDPHVWDLYRPGRATLTFGAGPHHCLGSSLAHVEIRALVRQLLRRLPSLTVVSPANPTPRGRTFRRIADLVLR